MSVFREILVVSDSDDKLFKELPLDEAKKISTSGFYDVINDTIIGLFKKDVNSVYVIWDDIIIPIDSINFDCRYNNSKGKSQLTIQNSDIKKEILYSANKPVSTIFYSEEDEDVDIGRWIFNVLNSSERLEIFIESNS